MTVSYDRDLDPNNTELRLVDWTRKADRLTLIQDWNFGSIFVLPFHALLRVALCVIISVSLSKDQHY